MLDLSVANQAAFGSNPPSKITLVRPPRSGKEEG